MTKPASKWLESKDRTTDLLMLGAILVFFVLTFPQAIFGGRYLLANDAFFYSFPLRTIAWNAIRAGELPLWTPAILSGYPLISMAQLAIPYPLTWGYLFLSGPAAEQIYVLAPFLLSPSFTYLYLRDRGRSPIASLFGGLTFAYGGMMAGPLSNNGLFPNAALWLPLLLVAIERARTYRLTSAIVLGTFAFLMSVLTGYGQGFTYIAIIAGAYAIYVSLTISSESFQQRVATLRTWRPVLAFVASVAFATGIAAYQIFETAAAVKRSVRSQLSYEIFTQGSLTPIQLLQSLTRPLFFGVDTYAYVPPLAIALALVAAVSLIRRPPDYDPRTLFWLALAAISIVLMLGRSTPLYWVIYQTPILNRFRVPSRHSFEWTFSIGILAAYGWDLTYSYLAGRFNEKKFNRVLVIGLAVGAMVVGVIWWRQVGALRGVATPTAHAGNVYLFLKLAFILLTTTALWRSLLIDNSQQRFVFTLVIVLGLLFVEPAALIARWWGNINLSRARFEVVADTTRFLQQFSPNENRVYTRVGLFSEQFEVQPRIDAPNLSALHNLQNVAGYEPLILERYSRALGGVGIDSVYQIDRYETDKTLLDSKSHVLDLLNTTHLITYSNLATTLEQTNLSGSPARMQSLGVLSAHQAKTFGAPPIEANSLLLVTSLANSVDIPQSTNVAKVQITLADDHIVEYSLRAGVDTSEWAHDRSDVKSAIKHELGPVFDSSPVTGPPAFPAYRFKTVIPFGTFSTVKAVQVRNLTERAQLALYGATVMNARTGQSAPLTEGFGAQWQPVYNQREALILRNQRALPRAWLVAKAEAVAGEEALLRIRGESSYEFDPKETVLLEVKPRDLPSLPGALSPDSSVRIVRYGPNRIELETNSSGSSVLVLSEIFYPGWQAEIDGQRSPILIANFLLRALSLSPGKHHVVMRYAAPRARNGAIISLLTLVALGGMLFYSHRKETMSSN